MIMQANSESIDSEALLAFDRDTSARAEEKLRDAIIGNFGPTFSPAEADAAGAFVEDALTEADALDDAPEARALPSYPAPRRR